MFALIVFLNGTIIVIITNIVIYAYKSNNVTPNPHIKEPDMEDLGLLDHGSLMKYLSAFSVHLLPIIWHRHLN